MKWVNVKLREAATIVGGYAFKSSNMKDECLPGYRPVVKIGNVSASGILDLSSVQYHEFTRELKPFNIKKDDVLIAMTGATVGKVSVSTYNDLLLNQRVGLIRPKEELLNQRFLYHSLCNPLFYDYCQFTAGGGAQGNISPSQILEYQIPLPPFHIQQQIADTLDKADALRRKDQELLQKYDQLAQAIFYEMFGDPINNSIGWETALLSEKTECITKGESPNWQGYEYQEEGILFVTSENVGQGKLILEGKTKYVPHKFHEKLKRSQLKEEDVLINLVGASIGRCTVFKNQNQPANINQAVALIRCCTNEILPDYLSFLLRTDHMQRIIKGDIVESARANISLNDINNYRIIVPPIEIQKKFVKVIEISRNQVKLIEKMPELFNVLLAETF